MNSEPSIPESFVAEYGQRVVALWRNKNNYKWEDIKEGDLVLTMRNGFGSLNPVVRKVAKIGSNTHWEDPNCLVLIDPADDFEKTHHKYLVYKCLPANVNFRIKDEHFWESITPITEEEMRVPFREKRAMIFEKTGLNY